MKLICRKCEKEIEDYHLKNCGEWGERYHFMITVECHGNRDTHLYGSFTRYFNASDHGNIYFFEKEDAPSTLDGLMKGIAPKKKASLDDLKEQVYALHKQWLAARDVSEIPDILKGPPFGKTAFEVASEKLEAENNRLIKEKALLEIHYTQKKNSFRSLESENNCLFNENLGLKERIERLRKGPEGEWALKLQNDINMKEMLLNGKIVLLEDEIKALEDLAHGKSEWREMYHVLEKLRPPPLTWTKEKPTETGKWFYRHVVGCSSILLETVFCADGSLHARGWRIDADVKALPCEWAGPIPEPGEPNA